MLCRFVSCRLNGLLSDVFLYLFLGFWGSISVTNLVHISVSRGGASPVGVFSCYFPMRETRKKTKSSRARVANDVPCSGSAASCMSSLYELRVIWLRLPTGSGSDDAKI